MKNQELFDKTVGILVSAYFNNTLQHGDCAACVVGNLISARRRFTKTEKTHLKNHESGWVRVFCTLSSREGKDQYFRIDEYVNEAKIQIDLTGYSVFELAKIEYAFETTKKVKLKEDWMFNGLMSVIDALMEIHEANQEECDSAKSLFTKELAV